MKTFADIIARWPSERIEEILASANANKIQGAMVRSENGNLRPEDFLLLLSPENLVNLEGMASQAHKLTLRNFGRAINIFTPLYISDVCTNQCRYCGFNVKNKQKRRHLSVDEAVAEAREIAARGFQHILLLTGDAPKLASPQYVAETVSRIKPLFASIGIEIYSLTLEEYQYLIKAGVDSMTMFQETYNPELYAWLHPVGPKHNYLFRLTAPERAAEAGMRSVGIGALLGLDEFEKDAFYTGLHAWWLQRTFPGVDISVSIPRICPHEGDFEVEHAVGDKRFVQYIAALRCFLPRCGITCSSRENAYMRNHLVSIGVTRVSAGVSTAVGGRATPDLRNPGQFEISDTRSLGQMMTDLKKLGFQPVLKDWEDPVC